MAAAVKFTGSASITEGSSYAGTMGMSTNIVLGMGSNTNVGMKSTTSYGLNTDSYFGGHNMVHLAPINPPTEGILGKITGVLFTKNNFSSCAENAVNISNNGIYNIQQGYSSRNRYIYQITSGFGTQASMPVDALWEAQRVNSNLKQSGLSIVQLAVIFTTFGTYQNIGNLSEKTLAVISTMTSILSLMATAYPILIESDLQSFYFNEKFKSPYSPPTLFQMQSEAASPGAQPNIFLAAANSSGITMGKSVYLEAGSSDLRRLNGSTDIKTYNGYTDRSKASTVEVSQDQINVQSKNIYLGFPQGPTNNLPSIFNVVGLYSSSYSDSVALNSKKFVFLTSSSTPTAAAAAAPNGFYVDADTSSAGVTIKNSTASVVMKEGNVTVETTTGQKILMSKTGITLQNNSVKFEMTDSLVEIQIGANSMKLQAGTGFFGGSTFKWIS